MANERNHGGARSGTGPKPKPPEQLRVYKTMRLAPTTDQTIRDNLSAGETYAATLDRIVREWAAAQAKE